MAAYSSFDWADRGGNQRRLVTVKDHIFWSYSVLSVSRERMTDVAVSERSKVLTRTTLANMLMSKFEDGRRKIGSLDRDDRLALEGTRVCMHFGCDADSYQMDHLLPKSRLNGETMELNQVWSCPRCNQSRGNLDLMLWHRKNQTFPSLSVLRRYLKLCYRYAERFGFLDLPEEEASMFRLPFVPSAFPRRFPPVERLVWDYAHPDRIR